MKKLLVLIIMLTFFAVSFGTMAIADDASDQEGYAEPAPNSGGGDGTDGQEDGGHDPQGDPAVSDEDPGDGDPNSPKLR